MMAAPVPPLPRPFPQPSRRPCVPASHPHRPLTAEAPMSRPDSAPHSHVYLAPTRMSSGSRLEELRRHLGRAVAGFFLIVAACFLLDLIGYLTETPIGVGKPFMDWLCLPVEQELEKFHDRRLERVLRDL